jgi:putative ABC transport system permease protein
MWRLGVRNASAHLGRLVLTAVAVLLGITFVSGSMTLTGTSQRVLDDQFRTATSGADLAIRRAVAFDAAMGIEVARVFVKLSSGVDAAAGRTAISRALRAYPTADVRDVGSAVEGRLQAIDQILGMVTVLLLLTVVIATLGIANTLALSMLERTRELGLLRAVGMTRRQLREMVRAEALLVAAVAAVAGLLLGGALAGAAVSVLGVTSAMTVQIPVAQLAGVILLAAAMGLLAGVIPARRAARLDVLRPIAAE